MPMGKKTTEVQTTKALSLLAAGNTQGHTAKAVGLGRSKVGQIAKDHKDTINQLALDLIADNTQAIRDNVRLTLNKAHKLLKSGSRKDIQDNNVILYLADRKEQRLMQMTGILPSHAPSVVINQLFQDNRVQGDSQELGIVQALLADKRVEDIQSDVQEAEIVENEDITP